MQKQTVKIYNPTILIGSILPVKLIGIKDVVKLTGLSKNTIRRLEKKEQFPSRRKLSTRRIGWTATEIEKWILETEQKWK